MLCLGDGFGLLVLRVSGFALRVMKGECGIMREAMCMRRAGSASVRDDYGLSAVCLLKEGGCNALRTPSFFSARADCEWSRRWQTGSAKDEHGGWLLLAARGWRDFCLCGKGRG